MKRNISLTLIGLLAAGILTGCVNDAESAKSAKPVIYLYPETTMEVSVELDFDGTLTTTYPAYRDGWTVTAFPDGTLINHADGREYSTSSGKGTALPIMTSRRAGVSRGMRQQNFCRKPSPKSA